MKKNAVWILIAFVVTGCSEPRPGDDWYQESVDARARRDEYISNQEMLGISPSDARKQHDLNIWIENTVNTPSAQPSPSGN
jgi:hypothetical protein